jgi:protein tyrosine/serine phosphatase
MFKHLTFIMGVNDAVVDFRFSQMSQRQIEEKIGLDPLECDFSITDPARTECSPARPPLRPAHSLDAITLRHAAPARKIEPQNFGIVREGAIYRSDFPNAANFSHLESVGIKTILTLVEGPYPQDYVDWIRKANINHIIHVLPPNKGGVAVQAKDLAMALKITLSHSNYPLLIHCNKGKHRTGCVVACYRRCQGDPLATAVEEYRKHAGAKARPFDEMLITQFDPATVEWEALMRELEHNMPKHSPIIRPSSMPA